MSEEIGRREANKRATRIAVERAARELFAAKGYEATSVREIADAAGVAERTLYRYFDGKEGLLAAEVQHWIELLQETIRDRPPGEAPLLAVQRATIAMSRRATETSPEGPIWLFTNHPRPFELLQKSAARPLLRFEDAITEALLARGVNARPGGPGHPAAGPDEPERYAAQIVARVSVAVIRSVAIRGRELGDADPATFRGMLEEAFQMLARSTVGLLD